MKNFPTAFETQMRKQLGAEVEAFYQAVNQSAPRSIRKHPYKWNANIASQISPVLWNSFGQYIEKTESFTLDPAFHGGAYYVQEASSMVLKPILESLDVEDPFVLDLCAAPGGKTTTILDVLDNRGLLISNEVIDARAHILHENVVKWGYSNVMVSNHDSSYLAKKLGSQLDIVVVDAPCSGEGLFRKDPKAIEEWSPEHVKMCFMRQRRILHDAVEMLADGGYLIYSTCTYNDQENIDNVQHLAQSYNLTCQNFEFLEAFQIREIQKGNALGYQFYPHMVQGEGFFVSVLRKQKKEKHTKKQKSKTSKLLPTPTELSISEDMGFLHDYYQNLIAIPKSYEHIIRELQSNLKLLSVGTEVGKIIKNKLVPAHPLALATRVQHEFPITQVSRHEALQYLHKDAMNFDTVDGWVQISFENIGLGWIKKIQHRCNNYYPKNWRIRMDIPSIESM